MIRRVEILNDLEFPTEFVAGNPKDKFHDIYLNVGTWDPNLCFDDWIYHINRAVLTELFCYESKFYELNRCSNKCGPNNASINVLKMLGYIPSIQYFKERKLKKGDD